MREREKNKYRNFLDLEETTPTEGEIDDLKKTKNFN